MLTAVRHVHSASYFLQPRLAPHLPHVLARAREAGATTTVDTNFDPARAWQGVGPLLRVADVLLPNATELLALTGRTGLDEAAHAALDLGCRVALKNGADGGVLWETPDEVYRVPAPPTTPTDTTGAGDSFDAGFISGMLDGLAGRGLLGPGRALREPLDPGCRWNGRPADPCRARRRVSRRVYAQIPAAAAAALACSLGRFPDSPAATDPLRKAPSGSSWSTSLISRYAGGRISTRPQWGSPTGAS